MTSWSRAEIARLRAENETLRAELADAQRVARYESDVAEQAIQAMREAQAEVERVKAERLALAKLAGEDDYASIASLAELRATRELRNRVLAESNQ
jgi:hypothetical protein